MSSGQDRCPDTAGSFQSPIIIVITCVSTLHVCIETITTCAMEMSTLTTNIIQEQFISEQPELNNNNICANNTSTSKFISTSTEESSNIGKELNSATISECVPVEPAPFDAPDESDTNSLLLPPLIEMPTDPNRGNEMLQNLPKDTSISFPDVSAQTLDENQEVKMVLPDAADPASLLNPNSASLPTDPLRTPPRPMIEDRTTVTGMLVNFLMFFYN